MMMAMPWMDRLWSGAFDYMKGLEEEDSGASYHTDPPSVAHSHHGMMSDQQWSNMLYMGNSHAHDHPSEREKMAELCLHGLYNKHLELWNFYLSDMDWLC